MKSIRKEGQPMIPLTKMHATLTAGGSSTTTNTRFWKHEQRRLLVGKPPNRAAVHGTKLPVTHTINKEEVEMEINQKKKKKEKRREEIEKIVQTQNNHPQESQPDPPAN